MTDIYASEEESNALIQPDTRTPEQKKADKLADKNWMNEQGVEPQRTWVGLTDEELAEFSDAKLGSYDLCLEVEAKLKEKNT